MDLQQNINYEKLALKYARNNDFEGIKKCIDNGAKNYNQICYIVATNTDNIHNTNKIISNLIMLGANDIDMISSLLSENGNDLCLELSKNHNLTALYACKGNQVEILKKLIDMGANNINEMFFIAKQNNNIDVWNYINSIYEEPLDI